MSELTSNMGTMQKIGQPSKWQSLAEDEQQENGNENRAQIIESESILAGPSDNLPNNTENEDHSDEGNSVPDNGQSQTLDASGTPQISANFAETPECTNTDLPGNHITEVNALESAVLSAQLDNDEVNNINSAENQNANVIKNSGNDFSNVSEDPINSINKTESKEDITDRGSGSEETPSSTFGNSNYSAQKSPENAVAAAVAESNQESMFGNFRNARSTRSNQKNETSASGINNENQQTSSDLEEGELSQNSPEPTQEQSNQSRRRVPFSVLSETPIDHQEYEEISDGADEYEEEDKNIPGPSSRPSVRFFPAQPRRDRRPEDDIPGPSNSTPINFGKPFLMDDTSGPSTSRRRRTANVYIPGISNSPERYNDGENNQGEDEPIEGEELERLLRIANVTRFQAGISANQAPRLYGPFKSPSYEASSSTRDQATSPEPTSKGPSYDADLAMAMRLQEEEDRQVRFESNTQFSFSSTKLGPSNRGLQPHDRWNSKEDQDGNEGDSEGDGGVHEIKLGRRMSVDEAFLFKECSRLYNICKNKVPDVFVPKPLYVNGFMPAEYIKGCNNVLSGGTFPGFDHTYCLPGPPGSPGPSEGTSGPATYTTAFRVVKRIEEEDRLNNAAFPLTTKKHMKTGSVAVRKQAFQASPISDNRKRPTAFQKFVRAHDTRLLEVPTKPLFSDPNENQPGTSGASTSAAWDQQLEQQRKRRLDALIDIESGEPERSTRRIATVREEDDSDANEDMADGDNEASRANGDVFAVPAHNYKIGQSSSSSSFSTGVPFSYETSPAGQRKIYEQRRKRPQLPRLQLPQNYYGEGPSTSASYNRRQSQSPPHRSGGSSIFSKDLMNRHSFLRRTDDDDSIFNYGGSTEQEPRCSSSVITEAAESNWPGIAWKDPEDMPMLDQIPENELSKMPPEYVEAIIEYQLGDSVNMKANKATDPMTQVLEARYLEICRSYVSTPNRIPAEIKDTRFEIYARFPFFQRPLYVQNVFVALHIADNLGDVLARVPDKYAAMSFAEFFKEGVKILFGLRLAGSETNKAVSKNQLDDSIRKYFQELSVRWYDDVLKMPEDEREEGELLCSQQIESVMAAAISTSDLSEMERYRRLFLEEQHRNARMQQMKMVGNSLSRQMSKNPAINRVRLADAVEVDDVIRTGEVQEDEQDQPVAAAEALEEGEIPNDDELTETQL